MSDERRGINPDETLVNSTADPVNNPGGDGVVVTERAASQGRTGSHTFMILVASLALVLLALFGTFFLHLGPLSSNHGAGGQSGTASHAAADQFHAAPPSPKQAPPGMPDSRAPSQ